VKADQVTVVIIVKIIIVKRIYTIRNKKADNFHYQLFLWKKLKKQGHSLKKRVYLREHLFIPFFQDKPMTSSSHKKIGILIESDFYEHEIFYYNFRFPEEGYQIEYLTRLWGHKELTFYGHEYKAPFTCSKSFETITDEELYTFAAIIVPAGMVADRLRYTEDVNKIPPATEFLKRCFTHTHIIKGIICHGIWLTAPAPEIIRNRKIVCHNNVIGDAKAYGAVYTNSDVVVDNDLVTARTGGHCGVFAKQIISLIQNKK